MEALEVDIQKVLADVGKCKSLNQWLHIDAPGCGLLVGEKIEKAFRIPGQRLDVEVSKQSRSHHTIVSLPMLAGGTDDVVAQIGSHDTVGDLFVIPILLESTLVVSEDLTDHVRPGK